MPEHDDHVGAQPVGHHRHFLDQCAAAVRFLAGCGGAPAVLSFDMNKVLEPATDLTDLWPRGWCDTSEHPTSLAATGAPGTRIDWLLLSDHAQRLAQVTHPRWDLGLPQHAAQDLLVSGASPPQYLSWQQPRPGPRAPLTDA